LPQRRPDRSCPTMSGLLPHQTVIDTAGGAELVDAVIVCYVAWREECEAVTAGGSTPRASGGYGHFSRRISNRRPHMPLRLGMQPRTTKSSVASTLAAREIEARAALIRLRDCSRKIEQAGGMIAVLPDRPEQDRARQLLRVLTTEAARLRVDLRNWDVAPPDWIDRVNGRLDQLVVKIEAMPLSRRTVDTSGADTPITGGLGPAKPAEDQVERRVYDYLYPRPGVSPAFSQIAAPTCA
jgi:hypothetical protein